MKKTVENRYPHAAALFKFCKEALEIRYEGNVKVIDQDVGSILGYDPADCSHWKKGKKNIRALGTLQSISDHLNIDTRLIIKIASGNIGIEEAIFEYKGYGDFSVRGKNMENLKKEYFKHPKKWQREGSQQNLDDIFSLNRTGLEQMCSTILSQGNFQENPIYIPELYSLFESIEFKTNADRETQIPTEISYSDATQTYTVFTNQDATKPFIRFQTVNQLFQILIRMKHEIAHSFWETPDEMIKIQANIFAGMLLVPAHMLKEEIQKIKTSHDIVTQLSERFWVSTSLMNQRLRDYITHNN